VRLDRWDEVLLVQEKIEVLHRRFPARKLGGICWVLAYSASVHALRGQAEEAGKLADKSYDIMIYHEGGDEEMWRQQAPFY